MAQHHLLNSIDMLLDPIRIGATNNAWVNVSEVIREYMTVTGNEWSNIGGKLTVPAAVFAFTVAATAAEAGTNYAATYGLRYLPLNNESIDLPPKQDQFGEDFWLLGAETDSDLAKVATATINSAGNTKVVSDAGVGTGSTDVQVRRRRNGANVDMLSTPITISVGEYFAEYGVIDPSNKNVNTGDQIFIDVDSVTSTKPNGLSVTLTFKK